MTEAAFQTIQTSANLDTNQRLTDLQLNQIMSFLSETSASDPLKTLQFRMYMSTRMKYRTGSTTQKFWTDPKFHTWESSLTPALILVKGDYRGRFEVQNFAVEIINTLRRQKVPTLWALKPASASGECFTSTIDLIKGLVCQAMQLSMCVHTQSSLTVSCAQFRAAETVQEWLDLLARTIAGFSLLYIIIDLEALGNAYAQSVPWLVELSSMFRRHSAGQWILRLKVLLLTHGAGGVNHAELSQFHDVVVHSRQYQKARTFSEMRYQGISTHRLFKTRNRRAMLK
jgi:hypothetical protein